MVFLRKSRIILIICCIYILTITAGVLAVYGLAFALNYSLAYFYLFGISWAIIWGIWTYNGYYTLYTILYIWTIHYFPAYFLLICYHLKQRLNSIRIRLNIIRNKSKSLTSNEKILMIGSLVREHNDLCQNVYCYNKYWRKYLTITYSMFLTINCILTYIVFISSGLNSFLRIEYAIVLSSHLLLIFIITYSASIVSDFNPILYKEMNSFCAKNNSLPIDIKMKV
jgi:hypothetical protein